MRVAVRGAGGQVGQALTEQWPDAVAFGHPDLDIRDAEAVVGVDWSCFDLVMNTAAYTAVDDAESADGRAAAWRANVVGVAHLVRTLNAHGPILVRLSRECVFDGRSPGETRKDAPLSLLSAYGASNAAGDVAAVPAQRQCLIRTTWVVGEGCNFVRTILSPRGSRDRAPAVADQVGRPTFADGLVDAVVQLTSTAAPYATYHVRNSGEPTTWADLACLTSALAGGSPSEVIGTTTAAYFADKRRAGARRKAACCV